MERSVRYLPADERTHALVWDRESGCCLSLEEFMVDRDYGEIVRDGRLAAELESLEGKPRYVCPYCGDAMGVRSLAIRERTEYRFYFDHRSAHHRAKCTGQKGHSPKALLARKFGLCKEGALHKAFKELVRDSLDADQSFSETKTEKRWWDIAGTKWRQPDIQTLHDGQRLAIEIQLSTTFVHVIAERMKFYRENSGYMLWLFKDLDLDDFRLSEDDLFYSNNRNAFRVTSSTVERSRKEGRLYLEGAWLEPQFDGSHIVDRKVLKEVPFDSLVLDICSRGIPRTYAFDYEGRKKLLEEERKVWIEEQMWSRLRQAFEGFYVALLRGEIKDHKERDCRWEELRKTFSKVDISLPQYAKDDVELERLLIAGYSVKFGAGHPIGIGFETVAELGHHIHKVWPRTLWFFRCMLRAHNSLQLIVQQDRTKKLQKKMEGVLVSLSNEESTFLPNRAWDQLLRVLFPEIKAPWCVDPSQIARTSLRRSSTSHSEQNAAKFYE